MTDAEINKVVAEQIMHFDHKHVFDGCEDCYYDKCVYCGYEPHCDPSNTPCEGLPDYIADDCLALNIVKEYIGLGWDIRGGGAVQAWSISLRSLPFFDLSERSLRQSLYCSRAPTFAEAVCRVICLYHGLDTGGGDGVKTLDTVTRLR